MSSPRYVLSRSHKIVQKTDGDMTPANSTSWANVNTSLDITLAARAGDCIEVECSMRVGAAGSPTMWFDVVSVVSTLPVNSFGQGVAAPTTTLEGVLGWTARTAAQVDVGGGILYELTAPDVENAAVLLRLRYRHSGSGTRVISATSGNRFVWWARNWGPKDPN